jgi:hypothetical protein
MAGHFIVEEQAMLDVFSLPSLRLLEEFNLYEKNLLAPGSDFEERLWTGLRGEIVDRISRNLLLLKKITFHMPLDLSWCSGFSHLSQLKWLNWRVNSIYEYGHLTWTRQKREVEDELLLASIEKIEKEFETVFANFIDKPVVELKGYYNPDL